MTAAPGSLSRLHDIFEPAAVSVWPLAPGAWALLVLMIIWLSTCCALWWLRRRRNAYRREAIRELQRIRRDLDTPAGRGKALLDLAVLVKRVALAAFPREQVAWLNGEAWIRFLDRTGKENRFAGDPGRLLTGIPYSNDAAIDALRDDHVQALLQSVAWWIRVHRTGDG